MLFAIVIGGLFGAVVGWVAPLELYSRLGERGDVACAEMPVWVRRVSASLAVAGGVAGAILMWRVQAGG